MSRTNVTPLLTVVNNPLVNDLLYKNHVEHDIFLTPLKLHNHFPHVLLSLYSFGASDERLKQEPDNERVLEKMLERKPEKITEENWKEHLGDCFYYPNYLDFFDNEVRLKGSLACLYKYAFHREVFPLLFEGFVHSVIHLGYGIEYDQPLVTAESLAEAVVHKVDQTKIIFDLEGFLDPSKQTGESKTPLEIIKLVYEDQSLTVPFNDKRLLTPPLDCDRSRVRYYSDMWKIIHDHKSVNQATEELYTTAFYLYATTCFDPTDLNSKIIKQDFFLLHILTSMLAVRVIVPYVPIPQAVLLLKSHFAMCILYYVTRGKPRLAPERLQNYQPSFPELQSVTTWNEVHKYGTSSSDFHFPKAVRAMEIGYELYEKNKSVEKDSLWFKGSIVTIEQLVLFKKMFSFELIGFDECWKQPPTTQKN